MFEDLFFFISPSFFLNFVGTSFFRGVEVGLIIALAKLTHGCHVPNDGCCNVILVVASFGHEKPRGLRRLTSNSMGDLDLVVSGRCG